MFTSQSAANDTEHTQTCMSVASLAITSAIFYRKAIERLQQTARFSQSGRIRDSPANILATTLVKEARGRLTSRPPRAPAAHRSSWELLRRWALIPGQGHGFRPGNLLSVPAKSQYILSYNLFDRHVSNAKAVWTPVANVVQPLCMTVHSLSFSENLALTIRPHAPTHAH